MLVTEASKRTENDMQQVLLRLSQACWIDTLETIIKAEE